MKQTRHHLADVIAEKTMHIQDSDLLAKEIAAFLLEEKLTVHLDSILRDVMQYRADRGIVEATTVSVSELPEHVIRDTEQLVRDNYKNAKEVIIRQKHDDDIVGGLRLEFPNEQLDMTVKAKLNKFRRLTAHERDNR